MGFRFRRSVRIMPGVRLNFSKSGVSTSLGPRGATINIGPKGVKKTVGLPGTGLSHTSQLISAPAPRLSGGQASNSGCLALLLAGVVLYGIWSISGGPTGTSVTPQSEAAQSKAESKYVSTKVLNCRAGASAGDPIVSKMARGETATVVSTSGAWSEVSRPPSSCWVASTYLADSPPPAASLSPTMGVAGLAAVAAAPAKSRRRRKSSKRRQVYDGGCPCSGPQVCIGPRGGRYCITSGGNKRYGV